MKREFVVELGGCEENPLLNIPSGDSYVVVQGKDANTITRQVEDIVFGNSEIGYVREVRVLDTLPEGAEISNEWSAYLEFKNEKFFEKSLQD